MSNRMKKLTDLWCGPRMTESERRQYIKDTKDIGAFLFIVGVLVAIAYIAVN